MSNESNIIDDRRGLIFTINREPEPVFQVESKHWADPEHRWPSQEIPPEIHAKVAEFKQSGKPGAFARSVQGDVGVYVICEENLKPLPEPADDDVVFEPGPQSASARQLNAYDIVICAKGGVIRADNGDTFETQPGDYYVVRCDTWGRFMDSQARRPAHVQTTKDMLHLLEDLHGKNFLSMAPDKPDEQLPPSMPQVVDPGFNLTCYVLNLARFQR